MRRFLTLLALAAVIAPGIPAHAEWWHFGSLSRDFHSQNDWPAQYTPIDRAAAQEPWGTMVNNGWRRQNLLSAHHFEATPEGLKLSKAGELKVYWILTQAPPAHRQIFVEKTLEAKLNAEREAAVQTLASQVLPAGESAFIAESTVMAEGRPAEQVDATNVRYRETMPAPQLPAFQSAIDQ